MKIVKSEEGISYFISQCIYDFMVAKKLIHVNKGTLFSTALLVFLALRILQTHGFFEVVLICERHFPAAPNIEQSSASWSF